MPHSTRHTTRWSSHWGFILAATGAAVGLGNIWRFPYMAGTQGGSAFVFLYIFFVLCIGIPIMLSEFLIGRYTRRNTVDALLYIAHTHQRTAAWSIFSWIGIVALVVILSFYSVVAGWSFNYLFQVICGSFAHTTPADIHRIWLHFLHHPLALLGWHSVFMFLVLSIVSVGVHKGIERATRYMVPFLYVLLIFLMCYALSVGDARSAFYFLFHFDAQKINTSVVLTALGHAFFTLALGAGALLTYGAYVPKKTPLVSTVCLVVFLDVCVALLSGLAIFPLVFSKHLEPASGPGLMFEVLPMSFSDMLFGRVIGAFFFLMLCVAAWSAALNLAEPPIRLMMDRFRWKRPYAAVLIGGCAWVLGIPSILSFNVWSNVQFLGQKSIFDWMIHFSTDVLLPIGGFGFAVISGWILTPQESCAELRTHPLLYTVWRFLIRYIAPIALITLFFAHVM